MILRHISLLWSIPHCTVLLELFLFLKKPTVIVCLVLCLLCQSKFKVNIPNATLFPI